MSYVGQHRRRSVVRLLAAGADDRQHGAGEHDRSLWEATGFAQRELLRRWLVLLVPVCMLYRIVSHRVSSRTSSTRDVVSEWNPCHRKIRRIA
jgi:hypothetical protein